MDENTLLRHLDLATREEKQEKARSLRYLTREEHDLFEKLKSNRFAENLRLEQERISWTQASKTINEVVLKTEKQEPQRDPILLSSQDLGVFLQNSKCSYRLQLKQLKIAETDANPLASVLGQMQQEFRQAQIKSLCGTNGTDTEPGNWSHRSKTTIKAIKEKQEYIANPCLVFNTSLRDLALEIQAEADLLILKEKGYIARNFRVGNSSKAEDSLAAQGLTLFGWVFGKLIGEPLCAREVLSSDMTLVELQADGIRETFHNLNQILEASLSPADRYEPVSWSKCTGCQWRTHCWQRAVSTDDLSVIPGVDQELALALRDEGVASVRSLLENMDHSSLSNFRRLHAGKKQKVGNKSKEILTGARALIEERPVVFGSFDLKLPETYCIIDFEGVPAYFNSLEQIFLWGMQVFGRRAGNYTAVVSAVNQADDESGWLNFLSKAQDIFETHGEIPFLYWHHYERTKLKQYVERYGDRQELAARINRNLIDLHPLVRNFVALPVHSYSLKELEKHIGFQRRLQNKDGAWAIAKVLESTLNSANMNPDSAVMDELITYNQEDILATKALLDWMLALKTVDG